MMETMDQGDVIIRPSSKGENHLTVTWKVSDGIYQHVDVREEGKENAFSLGATLWINSEVRASTCPPPIPLLLSERHCSGCLHLTLVTRVIDILAVQSNKMGGGLQNESFDINFVYFAPSFPVLQTLK